MDQSIRNKLRNVVTQCRKLLEDAVAQVLQGQFGIYATGKKDEVYVDDDAKMKHLSDEDRVYRKDLLDHLEHVNALGYKPTDSLAQLVREIAFTHLNRFCAYKMMEARSLIRESVSKGLKSQGFLFYLADHEDDEKRASSGQQDVAYRHFLNWLGGTLSEEIGVLFNPHDSANRLYPPQRVLDDVLNCLNDEALADIWTQDETIGWVYQYFTPKELRDAARDPKQGGSQSPRNSYELAFRNQFFTPRYVVEFLTDNTLGRIWYEMTKGETKLKDQCRYMVRRPTEMFLKDGHHPPKVAAEDQDELLQEEPLKMPVHIPHRPKKDPRDLKILDPACGSGHFLLYCFDLLLTIYEEAYADPEIGPVLQQDYPTVDALKRDVPRLIVANNLHGIDIDLRASQIAALALWLRCQRAYQEMGLKKDRPKITRSNFVCAEPMPGEPAMLKEFVGQLEPRLLGQLVEVVFEKMKLAGEAGSLLKIEEEIRTAVASAKQQWEAGPIEVQRTLFDRSVPKPTQKRFNLSGVTDNEFFDEAETKVVEALRGYAEKAGNERRFQRQLFTDDAVRGFAFVDICHKRFDVVLMNPPFGLFTESALAYAKTSYANASNDLYAAFVQRAISITSPYGFTGVISSRLGFFLEGLEEWRHTLLGTESSLDTIADLGYGVLDALVETAAYTIRNDTRPSNLTALNALSTLDKKGTIENQIDRYRNGCDAAGTYSLPLSLFRSLPSSVVAYWLPPHFASGLLALSPLKDKGVGVYSGLQTDDDFRFLRLWWEKDSTCQNRWLPFAKGGEYQPFADDLHLTVDWWDNGSEMKTFVASKYRQWSRHIKNTDRYFRAGLTFTERTTSDLSVRALPAGAIFSVSGPAVQCESKDDLYLAWAILSSRAGRAIIEIAIGSGDTSQSGTAARHYRTGIIAAVPCPHVNASVAIRLKACVLGLFQANLLNHTSAETHRLFRRSMPESTGIRERVQLLWNEFIDRFLAATAHSEELEGIVDAALGLSEEESLLFAGPHPARQKTTDITPELREYIGVLMGLNESDLCSKALADTPYSRNATKKTYYFDRRLELVSLMAEVRAYEVGSFLKSWPVHGRSIEHDAVVDEVSYSIGCIFGRWDLRTNSSQSDLGEVDPFLPLPESPPAMLHGPDGLPALESPADYPLRIDWDGILVDDSEHSDDVTRRVREVLEHLWKNRAESIERETCEILGVNDLRDYFRKPGKGGFWDDHISRYSNSRRKAPIYWLLQSSKKNYTVWLYYHRLDKDQLFKALVNYVEPKIRMEANRLDSLRSQKAAAGDTGKAAKRIDAEIEKQEDYISELRDFEDKLRRAANLHLEPDLNDGVVLNIAPLHELVPWKEAKSYWNELIAGEYEWSSIGKQLREKGLVT